MPGTHAILSASSSSRWLACPPSARINAELSETTSIYAEEGTKAHALAEKTLKGYLAGGPAEVQSDNEEMKEAVQRYVSISRRTFRMVSERAIWSSSPTNR